MYTFTCRLNLLWWWNTSSWNRLCQNPRQTLDVQFSRRWLYQRLYNTVQDWFLELVRFNLRTHFWWLSPLWKVWAGKVEVHCSWHCWCCSLTSWCCWWWWWRGGTVRTGWWKLYFIKFFMEITLNMNFLNTKPDHNILNFLKWKYFYSHEQEYNETVL